jgi:hypothetical protein
LDYVSINKYISIDYYYVHNNVGDQPYNNNKLVNSNILDYIARNKSIHNNVVGELYY